MMADKKKSTRPITFIDSGFKQRNIEVGDEVLRVVDSRITVTEPTHIEALDVMYGLTREDG